MNRVIASSLIVAVFLFSGCTHQKEKQPQPSETLRGVGLSPRSFGEEDFLAFFEKAAEAGEIVMWAGDWIELGGGAPGVVTELASTYGYTPLIEVAHFIQATGELIRPLTAETRRTYTDSITAFAEKYTPPYLGIGIEINVLYEKSPEDFDEFVTFYSEVYDAVKSVSSDTLVFTVFQLEKMKGLAFWTDDTPKSDPQWHLLERFTTDIVVFTTYPCLVFRDPSDIPETYYTEITSHTSKSVAFTEIGWYTDGTIQGWESNEAEQAAFIERFFDLTDGMDTEILVWSFLYDQDILEPFSSMGLHTDDGGAKKGWDVWLREEG